ncbi:MAG TPA: PRC-barrel domain-containing protein [Vicinamibacterales bacterium]|nr:PRC-barrel domain-containing protein [Vicinamibacterales bacterium]
MEAHDTRLCYLNAANVGTPAGRLESVPVCGPEGEQLGTVDGVLIDPAARRVRYFVIESERLDGTHRYLVPADALIRMECDRGAMRLEADADPLGDCDLDLEAIPPMNEDDLIAAIFARRAA